MIEYVIGVVFALVGAALGWFARGHMIASLPSAGRTTKPNRKVRRPKPGAVTAYAGAAPFRVVLLDGEVVYDGVSGGEARRSIERLRTQGVEWRAYRSGVAWDWGPRE